MSGESFKFDSLSNGHHTCDMQIRKAYKFRLKPTEAHIEALNHYVGGTRFLWNKVLAMNRHRLEQGHQLLWYHEADYWCKQWKRSEEYGFLKAIPAHCLQQKLKDLDKAFRSGFDKHQPLKRLPRFKKKGLHDSIRFPEAKHIQLDNRRIKLPKLGWIRFHKSQPIEGVLKNVTVSRLSGRWYISIQVEQSVELSAHPSQSSVGVDMGVTHFATLSTGEHIAPKNSYKHLSSRLAREQRRLSKKRKFSSNWKKQRARIRRLHEKHRHIRHDFLHKSSTQISKNHAIIVVEDLKVSSMSRSAKGTLECPGRQVKAKSGLNKAILDQGWGEFRRQLTYKQSWRGGMLVSISARYTSQCCASCGHIDKRNRPSQSVFACVSCGHKANADVNAAQTILAAGHAVLACGDLPLGESVKQESRRKSDQQAA